MTEDEYRALRESHDRVLYFIQEIAQSPAVELKDEGVVVVKLGTEFYNQILKLWDSAHGAVTKGVGR